MDNLRVFGTLVVVLVLALLSVFQMQLRGYEKVGRMEEWVLYVNDPGVCSLVNEQIYEDDQYRYMSGCPHSEAYLVKSGFEERELIYALEEGLITIEELDELIMIRIVEK